jgi:hypothetical protein
MTLHQCDVMATHASLPDQALGIMSDGYVEHAVDNQAALSAEKSTECQRAGVIVAAQGVAEPQVVRVRSWTIEIVEELARRADHMRWYDLPVRDMTSTELRAALYLACGIAEEEHRCRETERQVMRITKRRPWFHRLGAHLRLGFALRWRRRRRAIQELYRLQIRAS